MTGNLKEWRGPDIAAPPSNVQFSRKGGWFVSKTAVVIAAVLVVFLLLATALLTNYLTQQHFKANVSEKPDEILGNDGSDFMHISYEILMNHSSDSFNGDLTLAFIPNHKLKTVRLDFKGDDISSPSLYYNISNDDQIESSANTSANHSVGSDSSLIRSLNITSFDYNKEQSVVTFVAEEALLPGMKYYLDLKFQGQINSEGKGVFKIPYKVRVTENGSTNSEARWIIGANLAPVYCSWVFPCNEHLSKTVTARIKILHDKDHATVSNVFQKAVRDVHDYPNYELDDYDWTPPLPLSSLTYFILPRYKLNTYQRSNPAVNIWYPPHLENATAPLAQITASFILFYEEYFKLTLPVKRISIVVVDDHVPDYPGKLGVIPISSSLLFTRDDFTLQREEKLYYYLGRKMANQWLGNVVSFRPWSNYWLQEGFALYMTDVAASKIFLDYDGSTFISSVQCEALYEQKFEHPKPNIALMDIEDEAVHINTVQKGAFVFHMIGNSITPEKFKQGLQHFLEKREFQITLPDVFWKSINHVQNKVDVQEFVNTWTKKDFPVVSVSIAGGELILEQSPVSNINGSSIWWIPITFSNEELFDQMPRVMGKEQYHITIGTNHSWIDVNPSFSGFFRANYSDELWQNLGDILMYNRSLISSTDRAGLLDDSFSLASYGLLSYQVPLNITRYLAEETHILPWTIAMKHMEYISLFLDQEDLPNFQFYLGELINMSLSYKTESHGIFLSRRDKQLEAEFVHWSCKHGLIEDCIGAVERLNQKWLAMSGDFSFMTLAGEVKDIADCYSVRSNVNMSAESSPTSNVEKSNEELNALTCTSNSTALIRVLEQSLNVSDNFFSPRKTIDIWLSLKEIPKNSKIAFGYVKKNWSTISQKFKYESEILSAVLEGSTYTLTKESELNDVLEFKNGEESNFQMLRIIQNIVDKVSFNVAWRKNNLKAVKDWLTNANEPFSVDLIPSENNSTTA